MTPTELKSAVALLTGDIKTVGEELGLTQSDMQARLKGRVRIRKPFVMALQVLLERRRDAIEAMIREMEARGRVSIPAAIAGDMRMVE